MSSEIGESMQSLGELAPIEVPTVGQTIVAFSGVSAIRGALGTVYFCTSLDSSPLIVLDWDVRPIDGAIQKYLTDVFARLAELRAGIKITRPDWIALYAEPKRLGKIVLLEGAKTDFALCKVSEHFVEMDLEERAQEALIYHHAGEVKLAQPAFEKTVNFRGTSANHLRRQIAEYTPETKADSCELFTAFCNGILEALESGRG